MNKTSQNLNNTNANKNPNRVEAGKRAAAARGHESLSRAGAKGGRNSHGSRNNQQNSARSTET